MKKIRNLKANEIECRPQSVKDGKVTLLLYIDSRAATDLLDEVYGMENWNIEYKDVAGQIYGRLSIYDVETNRWVYREDTGSPANIEKEKSLASDIVKRCIVRFGVTELYTTPKITLDDDKYGNTGYKVSEIEYNEHREIIHLVITNRFNKEVFRWNMGNKTAPIVKTAPKQVINEHNDDKLIWKPDEPKKDNLTLLTEFCSSKKLEEGVNQDNLLRFYNYYKPKANAWKGNFDIPQLFNKWMTN